MPSVGALLPNSESLRDRRTQSYSWSTPIFRSCNAKRCMKSKCLHGEVRRLSVRAVKGAGLWRLLERSENPWPKRRTAGAGFSQEGRGAGEPTETRGPEQAPTW